MRYMAWWYNFKLNSSAISKTIVAAVRTMHNYTSDECTYRRHTDSCCHHSSMQSRRGWRWWMRLEQLLRPAASGPDEEEMSYRTLRGSRPNGGGSFRLGGASSNKKSNTERYWTERMKKYKKRVMVQDDVADEEPVSDDERLEDDENLDGVGGRATGVGCFILSSH